MLGDIWREEWGRLLALLVARTGRLDLAEDALADAFEVAARRWPDEGTPDRPAAWLYTTAHRRILDRLRHEVKTKQKAPLMVTDADSAAADSDGLLRLVLLAAHPDLSPQSGAALTLRLVLGISTADLARLFLVSEPTMAARLTRARAKVVASGESFALPPDEELPRRIDLVAEVAYLAFTAGYAPGSGSDVLRADLSGEAIRLVRLVSAQVPPNPTLQSLLALMLFQHARRAARVSSAGDLVLLSEQDRALWHAEEIAEAEQLLASVTRAGRRLEFSSALAASYLLQALIGAEHARAASASATDWVVIADLYRQLEVLTGSPVVRLNRAVAVAEAGDLKAALALTEGLADQLPRNHRVPAVRADLLARSGQFAAAGTTYDEAIGLCANDAELRLLRSKRERLLNRN